MEVLQTELFAKWLRRLRDLQAKAAILTRIERIEDGNFGDSNSVGGGISELRIHIGPGYRVYYVIRRRKVIILLCGGDKSSQQRDINRAQQIVSELDGGSINIL